MSEEQPPKTPAQPDQPAESPTPETPSEAPNTQPSEAPAEQPEEAPNEQPAEAPQPSEQPADNSKPEKPDTKAETIDEPTAEVGGATKEASKNKGTKAIDKIVEQAESRGKVYDSILQAIGNTPLVRLPKISEKYHVESELLAKLDYLNPMLSSKDRVAFAMIEQAEKAGKITPGKTILIEPTSGNMGFSLAFVASVKGYKLILTMPESIAVERRRVLQFLGADIELTPPETGMKGAIERAEKLLKQHDHGYRLDQFTNPANPQIHSDTTAEEIWADTEGKIDVLVVGVGSGGLLTGTARALKAKNKNLQVFAVEPAGSAVLSGKEPGAHKIQDIGAGFVPDVLDVSAIDSVVQISDEQTYEMAKELAQTEGVAAGISAGAVLAAAIEIAKLPDYKDKRIVMILTSAAERYVMSELFDR